MTSSTPLHAPPPFQSQVEEAQVPIASSFARTLRAFAEKQRAEEARPRPPAATPIAPRRTVTTLGSLPRGPQKMPHTHLSRESGAAPLAKAPAKPQPAAEQAAAAEEAKGIAKAAPAEKPTAKAKAARTESAPLLTRAWKWLQKQNAFSPKKQLRVSDTVSLGEKRFVAVVHVEGQKFLIGGGSAGVSLLAELDSDAELDIQTVLEQEETESSTFVQPIACAGGRSR